MASANLTGSDTQLIMGTAAARLRVQFETIHLHVLSGVDAGLEAALGLPNVRIGTASSNDLVLTDRAISRHHAEIRMTAQGLLLRDLGSTNGTFINGIRISEAYIPPDAECQLGYSRLSIRQRTEQRRVAIADQEHLGELVGRSEPMRQLYALIRAVAPTATTVHLHGESGSGKELVARTLHALSGRPGPFMVFDASVADREMVRNDLFGHIKGAFTGATQARDGAFRQADTGTLFIDEIGELPLDLQPRLLRVLETREVTPIGADKSARVDVRVITATHRDLAEMVRVGTFRADLFYRLSVVPIELPSLREIREDIPLIAQHLCRQLQLNERISSAAMGALQGYPWPGNVRELRNVLERAAVLGGDREINPTDLRLPKSALAPAPIVNHALTAVASTLVNQSASAVFSDDLSIVKPSTANHLKALERQMIVESLERNHHNKAAVARELAIPLSTLKRRIKEYHINEGSE